MSNPVGTGIAGLFSGSTTLCTRIAEHEDGALRVYIGPDRYALVYDEAAKAETRNVWAQGRHMIVPMPPADAIYTDAEDG